MKVILPEYESSIVFSFIKYLLEPVLGSATVLKFAKLFFVRRLERIADTKEHASH